MKLFKSKLQRKLEKIEKMKQEVANLNTEYEPYRNHLLLSKRGTIFIFRYFTYDEKQERVVAALEFADTPRGLVSIVDAFFMINAFAEYTDSLKECFKRYLKMKADLKLFGVELVQKKQNEQTNNTAITENNTAVTEEVPRKED